MEGKQRRPDRVLPPIIAENTGFAEPIQEQSYSSPPKQKKKPAAKMPIVPEIDAVDSTYRFPPLDLLSRGEPQSRAGDNEVRLNTERLEAAFQSFGVNMKISNATRGP